MGQSQSAPQEQYSAATTQPTISDEERAQAQAEVGSSRFSFALLLPTDRHKDACTATGSSRQAPCQAAQEANGHIGTQHSIGQEANSSGRNEQREPTPAGHGLAGRNEQLELSHVLPPSSHIFTLSPKLSLLSRLDPTTGFLLCWFRFRSA